MSERIVDDVVRYILNAYTTHRPITREDVIVVIDKKASYSNIITDVSKRLKNIFHMSLVDMGAKQKGKRYTLVSILPQNEKDTIVRYLDFCEHWKIMTVVCLIILAGGRITEERLELLLKKLNIIEKDDSFLKSLKRQRYISVPKEEDLDGETGLYYILGSRSFVEFDQEGIKKYIDGITKNYVDCSVNKKITDSITIGSTLSNIVSRFNKTP
eukprot:GHVP01040029.1.p1 GENE.GHVP01040029.1~~GHVP01040029.1.p1  ORF type:complete len:213 (-),score=30.10 GHVP01040029.1:6-644(-)